MFLTSYESHNELKIFLLSRSFKGDASDGEHFRRFYEIFKDNFQDSVCHTSHK